MKTSTYKLVLSHLTGLAMTNNLANLCDSLINQMCVVFIDQLLQLNTTKTYKMNVLIVGDIILLIKPSRPIYVYIEKVLS